MRKNMTVLVAVVGVLALAGSAAADSLSVTPAAAMGGTNYGLEVYHDNTDQAYVQDDTPDGEVVYRFTFLYNTSASGASSNFRQAIFRAWGPNPNPGAGLCPANPATVVPALQLWHYGIGGTGEVPTIQLWAKGNICGDQGARRINIPVATDVRICGEWWTGPTSTGGVGLAIVDPASACPPHGDPAYQTSNFSNNLFAIDMVRMGTPATNAFGAGEAMTMYFDEFASFRTLAP